MYCSLSMLTLTVWTVLCSSPDIDGQALRVLAQDVGFSQRCSGKEPLSNDTEFVLLQDDTETQLQNKAPAVDAAEDITLQRQKLNEAEIGRWVGKIVPSTKVPREIVLRGLISDQTALRADCARYLATHGDWKDIPFLIQALSDSSSHEGRNYDYAGKSTTRYWANVALIAITREDFGYRWDDPSEKRALAIEAWTIRWHNLKGRLKTVPKRQDERANVPDRYRSDRPVASNNPIIQSKADRLRAKSSARRLADTTLLQLAQLEEALFYDDEATRWAAQDALVELKAHAVPVLVTVLRDGDERAREHAANGLQRIGKPAAAAVPDLLESLGRDLTTSSAAARALSTVGQGSRFVLRKLEQASKREIPSGGAIEASIESIRQSLDTAPGG